MSAVCASISKSQFFQRFIIGTIILAGFVVGAQTYKDFSLRHQDTLRILDNLVLAIFVVEAAIKILAEGKKPQNYFKNPWNLFDFLIVAACLLEPIFQIGGSFLPVLRLARILRVLRLVTAIPKLQLLVSCLLKKVCPPCSM